MIVTLLIKSFSVNPLAEITATGNTAPITDPDNTASNGIVHVVDAVVLPIVVE